jgi:hypothetical protein
MKYCKLIIKLDKFRNKRKKRKVFSLKVLLRIHFRAILFIRASQSSLNSIIELKIVKKLEGEIRKLIKINRSIKYLQKKINNKKEI